MDRGDIPSAESTFRSTPQLCVLAVTEDCPTLMAENQQLRAEHQQLRAKLAAERRRAVAVEAQLTRQLTAALTMAAGRVAAADVAALEGAARSPPAPLDATGPDTIGAGGTDSDEGGLPPARGAGGRLGAAFGA